MKNITTWKLVERSLDQRIPVILLYVLESKGSSPGRLGFFMAVNAIGEMEGSIGGGIMEHKFVEMAREKLLAPDSYRDSYERLAATLKKQFHDKVAAKNQSGMICSGEQTILLYKARETDKDHIKTLIISSEQHKNGTLIFSPDGIQFVGKVPDKDFEFTFKSEDEWLYQEKTGYKNRIFIIGGGHCSLALSKLMREMDFYVIVFDDRKDLKTMTENKAAHEKHFINDYAALKELITVCDHHYIVIMTFGYRTDDIALRALIGKDFRYIGLLGSKTKIERLFEDYRKDGISAERLQRIHTPIGLDIKSQTPEEIAVSIAAEIIHTKNVGH